MTDKPLAVAERAELESLRDRVRELEDMFGWWDVVPALMICTKLTLSEARLVAAIIKREFLSSEQAYNIVYSDRNPDERADFRTIDQFMFKARRKLKPFGVDIAIVRAQGWLITKADRGVLLGHLAALLPRYMRLKLDFTSRRRIDLVPTD